MKENTLVALIVGGSLVVGLEIKKLIENRQKMQFLISAMNCDLEMAKIKTKK